MGAIPHLSWIQSTKSDSRCSSYYNRSIGPWARVEPYYFIKLIAVGIEELIPLMSFLVLRLFIGELIVYDVKM